LVVAEELGKFDEEIAVAALTRPLRGRVKKLTPAD
jgi:hypothetical protein